MHGHVTGILYMHGHVTDKHVIACYVLLLPSLHQHPPLPPSSYMEHTSPATTYLHSTCAYLLHVPAYTPPSNNNYTPCSSCLLCYYPLPTLLLPTAYPATAHCLPCYCLPCYCPLPTLLLPTAYPATAHCLPCSGRVGPPEGVGTAPPAPVHPPSSAAQLQPLPPLAHPPPASPYTPSRPSPLQGPRPVAGPQHSWDLQGGVYGWVGVQGGVQA